nr:hypothetical protein [Tanacetum cinerariifolium]
MIPEPGDPNREVPVNETFHVQTDDELTNKELKQIEADDQSIQTILLGLPGDIYAAVDSCETAQKIWLRVQQMMKGSDIRILEKKAKLFNEWEKFTSNDGESIESYYHCFLMLMNDLKRNNYFPEKFASNLKFLNNLQPEWSRHVTIVHQTKDLNTADYTQLYDFLKYNQNENVGNLNGYNDVQNVGNQVIQHAVQNLRIENVGIQNGLIGVPGNANQNPNGNGNLVAARAEGNATGHNGNQIRCYNCRGVGHFARNCTVRPRRRDVAYLQTQLLIAQKEEAGIQLQAEEFDLMAVAADLDEIEEVNANCILMANLQQASTSGTQTDKTPVYDSNGSAEVHNYENCYDDEIFNMFTQEEQYTELLEPISEPHQVSQNDNYVISEDSSMDQSGGTVEQHPANVEETRTIDLTLFIRYFDDDILMVQAYVDDIIFCSTHSRLSQPRSTLKSLKGSFYPQRTINMGLWYTKDYGFELTGFLDADYAGCKDTIKRTFSGAQFLGEKLVSWSSKKQDCIALSAVKSEYVPLSACCVQVFWMQT